MFAQVILISPRAVRGEIEFPTTFRGPNRIRILDNEVTHDPIFDHKSFAHLGTESEVGSLPATTKPRDTPMACPTRGATRCALHTLIHATQRLHILGMTASVQPYGCN